MRRKTAIVWLPALLGLVCGAAAQGQVASHKPAGKAVPVVTQHQAAQTRKRAAPKPAHSPRHAAKAAADAVPKPAPPPVPHVIPPPVAPDVGSSTGLHLPRFASLKTDLVNMRSGPGERYPVLWVYKRRELPMEIDREFDIWRLVTDMDGVKGWVHQATLTGRRGFVVTGKTDVTLRATASDTADAVAVLKPGVVGRLRSCEAASDWCQVQVGDYRGWLNRAAFFGALPGEVVQP